MERMQRDILIGETMIEQKEREASNSFYERIGAYRESFSSERNTVKEGGAAYDDER